MNIFKWIVGFFTSSDDLQESITAAPVEFDSEREAKVILSRSGEEFVVPKWTPLKDVLPYEMFSCRQGYCGTCTVKIQSGEENLTERKSTERTAGSNRRACQVAIKEGVVKIKA